MDISELEKIHRVNQLNAQRRGFFIGDVGSFSFPQSVEEMERVKLDQRRRGAALGLCEWPEMDGYYQELEDQMAEV